MLTPTFRYNPAVIAQAFATMGCLYPGRIFLGVGTGEALNEIATGYEGEWPEFKERYARLRESVRLMRELWLGDRVDFDGEYYKTKGASIYDVPEGGIPIYIAAGGPQVAKYAGRAGDGFICTSGKGEELYKDKLIPAMREGAEAAGENPDDIDRMIEIKISYDTDPELALENTRFWAPLSLTAEQKHQHRRPHRDGEGRRRAAHRAGRQALDRGVRSRRGRREGQGLRRAGASTTWCSTRPATTSGGSSSSSSGTWSPGCASSAERRGHARDDPDSRDGSGSAVPGRRGRSALGGRYLPISGHPTLIVAAVAPYLAIAAPVAVLLLIIGRRWLLTLVALAVTASPGAGCTCRGTRCRRPRTRPIPPRSTFAC